jgi:hypothetical protein
MDSNQVKPPCDGVSHPGGLIKGWSARLIQNAAEDRLTGTPRLTVSFGENTQESEHGLDMPSLEMGNKRA